MIRNIFFFSSRRRHTRLQGDWSSDVCSSDLPANPSQSVDPVTGQYVAGYTGFENEPGSFFGVGAEAGGKWSPADGVDLGANYSYERMFACSATASGGCTANTPPANQGPAPPADTPRAQLNPTAT